MCQLSFLSKVGYNVKGNAGLVQDCKTKNFNSMSYIGVCQLLFFSKVGYNVKGKTSVTQLVMLLLRLAVLRNWVGRHISHITCYRASQPKNVLHKVNYLI